MGRRMALRLLSSAEILDAKHAFEIGLVDRIADATGGLDNAVEHFLVPMRVVAPQAQRAFKALARTTRDRSAAEQIELRHFAACWAHPDHWAAHDQFMNRKRG